MDEIDVMIMISMTSSCLLMSAAVFSKSTNVPVEMLQRRCRSPAGECFVSSTTNAPRLHISSERKRGLPLGNLELQGQKRGE